MELLRNNGIAFVEKAEYPPNAPQIRPIEHHWGILKMEVYEGNLMAKTRDHLIRRNKMKQKEINHDIVIEMLDNLKGRVHVANPNGQKLEINYLGCL